MLIFVNEKGESGVIVVVFGKEVFVLLIKFFIGYLLGAVGVVEVIVIIEVMCYNFVLMIVGISEVLDYIEVNVVYG